MFIARRGPVFVNLLLADEINRAPAKTQAALLEVMQEAQVTIEGEAHPLEPPFMVLATQNPIEQEGTYPLPEAQLDRFLLKVRIDYPSPGRRDGAGAPRHRGQGRRPAERRPGACRSSSPRPCSRCRQSPRRAADRRRGARLRGAPRARDAQLGRAWSPAPARAAAISLVRAARAAALLEGRDFVTPDDVKRMALPALRHRIAPSPELELEGRDTDAILKGLLEKIEAPRK